MTLRDDAKMVAETIGKLRQAPGPLSVLPDGYDEACLRLANAVLDADEVVDGVCRLCGHKGSRLECFDGGLVEGEEPRRTIGCRDRQIERLTAKLATVSADLADLADLKQRIEAAPVAWCLSRWDNQMCALTKDRPPESTAWPTRKQVRLLEVGDGE